MKIIKVSRNKYRKQTMGEQYENIVMAFGIGFMLALFLITVMNI